MLVAAKFSPVGRQLQDLMARAQQYTGPETDGFLRGVNSITDCTTEVELHVPYPPTPHVEVSGEQIELDLALRMYPSYLSSLENAESSYGMCISDEDLALGHMMYDMFFFHAPAKARTLEPYLFPPHEWLLCSDPDIKSEEKKEVIYACA